MFDFFFFLEKEMSSNSAREKLPFALEEFISEGQVVLVCIDKKSVHLDLEVLLMCIDAIIPDELFSPAYIYGKVVTEL